ncbi:MAG: MoxR family ATPase [Defluviitaleaceae bacterium]|nr:MoxR family ATPase [Defluviitaleaceae bacterium]
MIDKGEMLKKVVDNVEKVIVGKREAIELALCSFLCGGHVLIEDMPGVGKTSLVSSIAKSFEMSFRRIQFTPDILPSDITGFSMYNQKEGEFEYRAGAIMSNIVLADEINRTSPKTQSALLEVMEEGQVTVDGDTYHVPKPFIVFATQNPIEYLGTYPLPEAQLDRFFMRISLGYPKACEELTMLERFGEANPIKTLESVASLKDLEELQKAAAGVYVSKDMGKYIVDIVRATRENKDIALGGSPRASLSLYKAAQAWAFYNGRDHVVPDDIIKMAAPVLEHRLVLRQEAHLRRLTTRGIIDGIVRSVRANI